MVALKDLDNWYSAQDSTSDGLYHFNAPSNIGAGVNIAVYIGTAW